MRPDSFIDLVELRLRKMPKQLHRISEDNQIRIIDTPHVWGAPMTEEGVAAQAESAVQGLAQTIEDMIGDARALVDIVSLNPADGVFLTAIQRGLKALAVSKEPVTVRFLFGWVPTRDTVKAFRNELAVFCENAEVPIGHLKILIGQYYSYKGAYWNHAKIVAVDGKVALVGGHNMWDAAYAQYPPVHDISVEVKGDAARGAHDFAEFLWGNAKKYLEVWEITDDFQVVQLAATSDRDAKTAPKELELKDRAQHVVRPRLPKEVELRDFSKAQGKITSPWRAGRIMALGRAGGLDDNAYNASDIAKETIIKGAKLSLKICQQDLLFLGTNKARSHLVCRWISEALLASPKLVVQIVVSPIDGSGGGDQYSWGSGAIGTRWLITKMIEILGKDDIAAMTSAIDRLHVAPFCFTDVKFTAEGVDYRWVDVPKKQHAGRFGTTIPTPGLLGKPPAPGLHAKVYIADDCVYYVGSDNMYPHNLAEFGYLVEGPSVATMLSDYWDNVWRFSKPHQIVEDARVTTIAESKALANRTKELIAQHDELFEL